MSNKKPKIIIRLMILNYSDDLVKEIIDIVKGMLSAKYQKLNIKLDTYEKYWKYPELTDCCFGVYCEGDISVRDILNLLFDLEYCNRNGEGIWNVHTHGGIFIHKNVEWAHVYDWR